MQEIFQASLILYRILIVAHDYESIQSLGETIEKKGFELNKINAVDLVAVHAKEKQIDLVIVDLMIPNYGGFQAVRNLRLDPQTRSLPVIVIGDPGHNDHLKVALELGASDYLMKDNDLIEKMVRLIEKYLIHFSARRNLHMD